MADGFGSDQDSGQGASALRDTACSSKFPEEDLPALSNVLDALHAARDATGDGIRESANAALAVTLERKTPMWSWLRVSLQLITEGTMNDAQAALANDIIVATVERLVERPSLLLSQEDDLRCRLNKFWDQSIHEGCFADFLTTALLACVLLLGEGWQDGGDEAAVAGFLRQVVSTADLPEWLSERVLLSGELGLACEAKKRIFLLRREACRRGSTGEVPPESGSECSTGSETAGSEAGSSGAGGHVHVARHEPKQGACQSRDPADPTNPLPNPRDGPWSATDEDMLSAAIFDQLDLVLPDNLDLLVVFKQAMDSCKHEGGAHVWTPAQVEELVEYVDAYMQEHEADVEGFDTALNRWVAAATADDLRLAELQQALQGASVRVLRAPGLLHTLQKMALGMPRYTGQMQGASEDVLYGCGVVDPGLPPQSVSGALVLSASNVVGAGLRSAEKLLETKAYTDVTAGDLQLVAAHLDAYTVLE